MANRDPGQSIGEQQPVIDPMPAGHPGDPHATPFTDGLGVVRSGFELDQRFDEQGLLALRSAVSAHAAGVGVAGDRVDDLVVIAHELASNAVRHGGGTGRLRLWRQDGRALCEVSDSGAGLADPLSAGYARVPLSSTDGRGLWIVRQLADHVEVHSGPDGTVVIVVLTISGI